MKKSTKKQLQKRSEIINAATELMKEIDFEEITIRAICKVANISIGTFYHYFNDKGDIIIQLYTSVDEYLEKIEEEKFNNEDELENIRLFAEYYGRFVSGAGINTAKNIFTASINTESEYIYRSRERVINRIILNIVKRAKDKKMITIELSEEEIANIILINIRGVVFDWCKFHGQYDLVFQIKRNIEIFIKGIC